MTRQDPSLITPHAAPAGAIEALAGLLNTDAAVPVDVLNALGDVSKVLDWLERCGCQLDIHPQRGVRLVATGLGCWADYIEARHIGRLGHLCKVYQQTQSTQEIARRWVGRENAHGIVVVADEQQGGRGRLGRRWFAPPGTCLLCTLIVNATSTTSNRLSLAACCAVSEAIEAVTVIRPRIRWPNDLLIGDAKVAGILIDIVNDQALIGIGVNVSLQASQLPPDDAGRSIHATSLRERGACVDRLRLLDVLLEKLNSMLLDATDDRLSAYWRKRSCLLQQRVTLEADGRRFTGRVVDIDPNAGLCLADDLGVVHVLSAGTTSLCHTAQA